jgi:hypothetical protein
MFDPVSYSLAKKVKATALTSPLTFDLDFGGYRGINVGAPTSDTDVPRARASDILSGTFDVARIPLHSTSLHDNTISKKRRIYISLFLAAATSTATTYTLQVYRVNIDFDAFDKVDAVYFEVAMAVDSGYTGYAELYNVTDGTSIAGSEVSTTSTTTVVVRSGDIKANLPSGEKTYGFRLRVTGGTQYIRGVRIVVVQKESFSDGFETGDWSEWDGAETGGEWTNPAVTSELSHHGLYSLKSLPDQHSQAVYKMITPSPVQHLRAAVLLSALPSSGKIVSLLTIMNRVSTANRIAVGVYNDAGVMKWMLNHPPWYPEGLPAPPKLADTGPVANKWYQVELRVSRVNSTITCDVYVDGVAVISGYVYTGDTSNFDCVRVGGWDKYVPDNIAAYVDCVVSSTSYIGPRG